jgi:hypothetical protein
MTGWATDLAVPDDDGRAIAALAAAARTLSPEGCRELARLLIEHVVVQSQNDRFDLHPLAALHARAIGALRSVAELVGHPPTTTEYQAEFDRRRALGDSGLPSVDSIVREFGGWPHAQIAAGLIPAAHPSAFQRRRDYQRKKVHRYSDQRLRDCLNACARDLGRIPMVRDQVAWREELLRRPATRRTGRNDIPHWRTYYERYGDWSIALADAGLSPVRAERTETTDYTDLT